MITESKLIEKGFNGKPHASLGTRFRLDVGRDREIEITGVGTTSEMMVLTENDWHRDLMETVLIHVYTYDGFLTEKKLDALISVFKQSE